MSVVGRKEIILLEAGKMFIHIISDEIFGKAIIWNKLEEKNVPDAHISRKQEVICVLITSGCI